MSHPSTELAPVALFAYKRAEHLAQAIASLQANPEAASTRLYVFCDQARSPVDRAGVDAVRERVAGLAGFASITRVYRDVNYGLAHSIIEGVTDVLSRHDRIIVLEDDLVLSPHFLGFMNDALMCYADDALVASIHGYSYPTDDPLPTTFFLRGADCWGWATWRRAWRRFRPDGRALLGELEARRLTREFDLDGAYPYTRMLRDQIAGRNDSWAIRWHASCFLADLLTLYPGRSLVENIGNDASGTHCAEAATFSRGLSQGVVRLERIPVAQSAEARDAFIRFFRSRRGTLRERAGRMLRRIRREIS